jgi:hypothetical protein
MTVASEFWVFSDRLLAVAMTELHSEQMVVMLDEVLTVAKTLPHEVCRL